MILVMAGLLAGLGALLGHFLMGPDGTWLGIVVAVGTWGFLLAITLMGGEEIVLMTSGAREIRKVDAPRLWNIVEEMQIAAGLPSMPRVYVLDGYMQNAFAVGRSPASARIVVTEGLLRRLNRDELQGVVAHEIGHVRNLDIRFMTIASVMLGSVTLLADAARRALWFGGGRRARLKGPPQVWVALMVAVFLAATLAPFFARLLYLACSRQREFLADASAARFTRFPEGLASALEKIEQRVGVTRSDSASALVPLYIVNPLHRGVSTGGWYRTHPPTAERIRILRSMGGGAGWGDYERAYRRVHGGACLDPGLLEAEPPVAVRAASNEEEDPAMFGLLREVRDALDRSEGLLSIPCSCGVRVKVPEGFPKDSIRCPRCGAVHAVPGVAPSIPHTPGTAGFQYRRRGSGWDSFRCSCGKLMHLSPALRVSSMRCKGCGRKIWIRD